MARRGIRYNITQAFFELVSASGALAIAQQDLDQGRASEELSSRKLKAGMIPEVELLQIQVDLARREGGYRSTLSSLETARDRLRNQLGLPLDQPIEPLWEPGAAMPVMPAGVDTAGETLDLKRQRLNLSRVELENRASRWQERVQATLQLYYEEDVRRRLTQDLDERGDRNRGVTVSLDLPLFGFGTTSGKVQELKARLRQARVEYTQSKAESSAELRQAVRQVELALDRIKIADAALELSQRSYEITTGRFDSGLVDARELLEAQIRSLEEELCQPENYLDYEKAGEINRTIISKKQEKDILFSRLEETMND
jgi:outer membrane protein TolC